MSYTSAPPMHRPALSDRTLGYLPTRAHPPRRSSPPALTVAEGERSLRRGEWRTLAILGIPSLALALATTVVTTYLPVRLHTGQASTTTIGLLIGTEGIIALFVPLIAGAWSDRLQRPLGGRLPFVLAAAPPLTVVLVLLGFVTSLGLAAILLALFFTAYFVAYEPYRALYPDLIDDAIAGRGQSTQALARGLGTFLALIGGGVLLALAKPVPFIVAAVIVAVALGSFGHVTARMGAPPSKDPGSRSIRDDLRAVRRLVRERRDIRHFLAANALWEASLGALKTFVVLYLTVGQGVSVATSSLIIGGVALLLLAASPISGKLADEHGRVKIMHWALLAYGVGLLIPFIVSDKAIIAIAVPFIAFGGGVVMTLPFAVLIGLMDEEHHGALSGLYSFSRGIGTAVGPILAGAAISVLSGPFSGTRGYQAIWGVCAATILLSLWPLRALRGVD